MSEKFMFEPLLLLIFKKRTFAEMIQYTHSCFSWINSMRQTFVNKHLNSAGDNIFHSSWMQASEEPGKVRK